MNDLISLLQPHETLERCGLVVDGELIEVTNIHLNPLKGFRMDPTEMLPLIEKASASWHTHPQEDPELSEEDYAGFTQWPKLVHHIVGVREGVPTVESYEIVGGLVIKK